MSYKDRFDDICKHTCGVRTGSEILKYIKSDEYTEPDNVKLDTRSAKEILAEFEANGGPGICFNYPGGYGQFKKDVNGE